jgi:hypothetical protein
MAVIASSVLLSGAAAMQEVPLDATGSGSVLFGHDPKEQGVGYFFFRVETGENAGGTFLFAGEVHEHGDYPHVVLRMPEVHYVRINENQVRFAGIGQYHFEDVFMTVLATDGGSHGHDALDIKAINMDGEVVVEGHGDLFMGDILVGVH